MICKAVQDLGPGDDETRFLVAQKKESVAGLDAIEIPGLLGDDDLPPVADLGRAEDPLFGFAENVFASRQKIHFLSHFSYFSHREIITKTAPIVNIRAVKCRKTLRNRLPYQEALFSLPKL